VTGSDHSEMKPISPAHRRLGAALRKAREVAGINTRTVPKPHGKKPYYSPGHISLVENGRTAPSPELIRTYASFATVEAAKLTTLYDQAMAERSEAGRRRRGIQSDHDAPMPTDAESIPDRWQVQQNYLVEVNTADCTFDERGVMREATCTAALRATSPDVRLAYAGHGYPADPRPGVLQVEALSGATLSTTRESATGTIQCYFRLNKALYPDDDEPHLLRYRVTVDSEIPMPRLRFQAEAGNHRLVLRARFTPPAIPRQIWWVEAASTIDADYPVADRMMEPELADFSRTFDNLVPGWLYGYAWNW
jgi:hypothetical protein